MSTPCPLTRQVVRALVAGGAIAACWSGLAQATAAPATIHTSRGCYEVRQPVSISGRGFSPLRTFDLAIAGVDLGQSTTDASGGFSVSVIPGGLAAGQPQLVEQVDASDGTSDATAAITVTQPRPGARLLTAGGSPSTLRAPFELWSFALDGRHLPVYLHYVAPSGLARTTVSLGRVGGQCGYLRTGKRRVFPFSPGLGRWTLQIDTSRRYHRRPAGAVARIAVVIRRG